MFADYQPDKRRFITALKGGIPDRVPYYDNEFAPHVIDAVLGRTGSPDSKVLAPSDLVEFSRRIGLDMVYASFNWGLGRVYHQDSNGNIHYVDGCIKDRNALADISPPDMSSTLERLDKLSELIMDTGMGLVLGIIPPYKLVKVAIGYQDFLLKSEDDVHFIKEFLSIGLMHLKNALDLLLKYPVDAIQIAGDLCSGHGPMISPKKIRELWLDNTREFIQPAKERGIPVILHMDGDFSSLTDLMLETGSDAFHPFEVNGNLDIYEQKKALKGKAAVMGNIDCTGVLPYGTPDEVRADVKRHIELLAPGGGYICGSSHEIMPDVPLENFYAMISAVQEYGTIR